MAVGEAAAAGDRKQEGDRPAVPSFAQHCEESVRLFGDAFEVVHKFLDELAGKPPYGMKHRRVRHHLAGIEEVRRRWGDKAAAAARQHVVADLKMEGWREGDPNPRDEKDYVRMGLF